MQRTPPALAAGRTSRTRERSPLRGVSLRHLTACNSTWRARAGPSGRRSGTALSPPTRQPWVGAFRAPTRWPASPAAWTHRAASWTRSVPPVPGPSAPQHLRQSTEVPFGGVGRSRGLLGRRLEAVTRHARSREPLQTLSAHRGRAGTPHRHALPSVVALPRATRACRLRVVSKASSTLMPCLRTSCSGTTAREHESNCLHDHAFAGKVGQLAMRQQHLDTLPCRARARSRRLSEAIEANLRTWLSVSLSELASH